MKDEGQDWTRRQLLGAAVGGAAALLAAPAKGGAMMHTKNAEKLPTIFIAHGAPPCSMTSGAWRSSTRGRRACPGRRPS
jgi:hypothetical protein